MLAFKIAFLCIPVHSIAHNNGHQDEGNQLDHDASRAQAVARTLAFDGRVQTTNADSESTTPPLQVHQFVASDGDAADTQGSSAAMFSRQEGPEVAGISDIGVHEGRMDESKLFAELEPPNQVLLPTSPSLVNLTTQTKVATGFSPKNRASLVKGLGLLNLPRLMNYEMLDFSKSSDDLQKQFDDLGVAMLRWIPGVIGGLDEMRDSSLDFGEVAAKEVFEGLAGVGADTLSEADFIITGRTVFRYFVCSIPLPSIGATTGKFPLTSTEDFQWYFHVMKTPALLGPSVKENLGNFLSLLAERRADPGPLSKKAFIDFFMHQ